MIVVLRHVALTTLIAQNDDAPPGYCSDGSDGIGLKSSLLSASVTSGHLYYVVVTGHADIDHGHFGLTTTCTGTVQD